MSLKIQQALRAGQLLSRGPIASTSQVHWEFRRHATFGNPLSNPLNWVKEKLSPTIREKDSTEELEAARTRTANDTIFADIPTAQDFVKRRAAAKVKTNVVGDVRGSLRAGFRARKPKEHKYSTANFKISHRKLNMLGRQIAGKPIDHAILQMQFSEKRASKRIKSMLVVARDHALNYKGLDRSKMVVDEAWVTKGPNVLKRFEPRGRGHHGIRQHPDSRMHVVLREDKMFEEKQKEERARKIKRIVGAGLVREDVPLRNPGSMWAW